MLRLAHAYHVDQAGEGSNEFCKASGDVPGRDGDTPLHWTAAANTNVVIITTLIEASADVNATDKFGWTPIHTATESNANPAVIEALPAAGARHKRRAYFVLFGPEFLLKHNSNMSDDDKKAALELLKESD